MPPEATRIAPKAVSFLFQGNLWEMATPAVKPAYKPNANPPTSEVIKNKGIRKSILCILVSLRVHIF